MPLLDRQILARLTPAQLWNEIGRDTREQAARALYDRDWEDADSRAEADLAIAAALRFREQAVRRLPQDKRAEYLVRAVRPDESLAAALLMALHLVDRREMLETFLDELGIPQERGVIDGEHEIGGLEPARLAAAVGVLRERFPPEHVDLYVASLIAMDRAVWGALAEVVAPPQG